MVGVLDGVGEAEVSWCVLILLVRVLRTVGLAAAAGIRRKKLCQLLHQNEFMINLMHFCQEGHIIIKIYNGIYQYKSCHCKMKVYDSSNDMPFHCVSIHLEYFTNDESNSVSIDNQASL